jgi:hypothetical protein
MGDESMNCPWKEGGDAKKCIYTVLTFVVSIFCLSIVIKLIACFLDLFSRYHTVNAFIVIAAVVIVLVGYSKCCPKSQ